MQAAYRAMQAYNGPLQPNNDLLQVNDDLGTTNNVALQAGNDGVSAGNDRLLIIKRLFGYESDVYSWPSSIDLIEKSPKSLFSLFPNE